MGFHRAVAGMSAAGNHVVVDYVLSQRWRLLDCLDLFTAGSVVLVGVHCPLLELERREQVRGDRTPGLAATWDRTAAVNLRAPVLLAQESGARDGGTRVRPRAVDVVGRGLHRRQRAGLHGFLHFPVSRVASRGVVQDTGHVGAQHIGVAASAQSNASSTPDPAALRNDHIPVPAQLSWVRLRGRDCGRHRRPGLNCRRLMRWPGYAGWGGRCGAGRLCCRVLCGRPVVVGRRCQGSGPVR
ncbi:MAG: chloramphenicol phosphotransferase, partial [Actinomycetia bacterium]|nr:chloramphenicol phosphotransferase [Actinomycetes bacterium]